MFGEVLYFFNPSTHIGKSTLLGQFPHKLCIESSMFDKYEYHKYFSSVSVGLYWELGFYFSITCKGGLLLETSLYRDLGLY